METLTAEELRAERLNKLQAIRRLQSEVADIDAELLRANAKERNDEMRQRREACMPLSDIYRPHIYKESHDRRIESHD